jgi:hypothetical protein
MVCYKCDKCNTEFDKKSTYDNHLKRIKPCNDNKNSKHNSKIIPDPTSFMPENTIESLIMPENNLNKELHKEPQNIIKVNSINRIDNKMMEEYLKICKCVYCNKKFSRRDNVLAHIKNSCVKVKEIEEQKHQIFTKLKALEEENQKLKEKMEKKDEDFEKKLDKHAKEMQKKFQKEFQKELRKGIEKGVNKIINNNNTASNSNNNSNNTNIDNSIDNSINNSQLNTQQNIYLANYGPNNMPALTNDEIVNALKRGFQTPVELTRKIHFNPKFPEFHNIYIPRINERYGMIYTNDDWKIMDKDDLVEDIYENKRAFVVENLDTYINQLDEFKKKSLKRWLDRDDDDESVKNTKDDIKKLLFDNRKMAMARKKELENLNKKKKLEIIKRPEKKLLILDKNNSDSENNSDSDNSSEESNYSYESKCDSYIKNA